MYKIFADFTSTARSSTADVNGLCNVHNISRSVNVFITRETMLTLVDRLRRVGATRIADSYARTLLVHRRHRPFSRNNSARGRAVKRKHACGISSASPPTQILNLGSSPCRIQRAILQARSALRASAVLPYKGSREQATARGITFGSGQQKLQRTFAFGWLTLHSSYDGSLSIHSAAMQRNVTRCAGEIHV